MTILGWTKPLALVLCATLVATRSDCGGSGSKSSLSIHIVSPSSTGSFATDLPTIAVGGTVGGWTFFDPTPTITWHVDESGLGGTIGQLLGTFDTGQIALDAGWNTVHVRAENGKQKSASDLITIFRGTP